MRHITFLNSSKRKSLAALYIGFQLTMCLAMVANFFLSIPPAEAQTKSKSSCFTQKECTGKYYNGDFPTPSTDDQKLCGKDRGPCYAKLTHLEGGKVVEGYPLIVNIGGTDRIFDIGQYIAVVYKYGTGVASVVAAVMMMLGGFQYLTAGGDSGRVSAAKERIQDAVVGLFLALGAYVILQTINPELVSLKLPRVPIVKKSVFGVCKYSETLYPCGTEYGVIADENATTEVLSKKESTTTDQSKMGAAIALCVGRGCSTACGNEERFKCREVGGEVGPTPDPSCNKAPAPTSSSSSGSGQPSTTTGQPAASTPPPAPKYLCKACAANGDLCTPGGPNRNCCNGYCGGGTCSDGQVGATCSQNTDCATGICNTSWGNICTAGEAGSPCDNNQECKPGYRCSSAGWITNVCVPGTKFSECNDSTQCRQGDGLTCNSSWHMCMPGGADPKLSCDTDADCGGAGGSCVHTGLRGRNFCTDGSVGSICYNDSECETGICITSRHICGDGSVGSRCDGPKGCSNFSSKDKPTEETLLAPCLSVDWMSGLTDAKYCVSGEVGSRCSTAGNCLKGLKCGVNKLCTH